MEINENILKDKPNDKMDKIKLIRKVMFWLSLSLGLVCLILFICYNLVDVMSIFVKDTDKFDPARLFPGWQVVFYGYGVQMILGYHEFDPNPILIIGMMVPIISIIVNFCLIKKGKNRMKATLAFIEGIAIIVGAIILINVNYLVSMSISKDISSYYVEALKNNGVNVTFYPIILLIVGLIGGLSKLGYGIILLYQRKYAMTLKK